MFRIPSARAFCVSASRGVGATQARRRPGGRGVSRDRDRTGGTLSSRVVTSQTEASIQVSRRLWHGRCQENWHNLGWMNRPLRLLERQHANEASASHASPGGRIWVSASARLLFWPHRPSRAGSAWGAPGPDRPRGLGDLRDAWVGAIVRCLSGSIRTAETTAPKRDPPGGLYSASGSAGAYSPRRISRYSASGIIPTSARRASTVSGSARSVGTNSPSASSPTCVP